MEMFIISFSNWYMAFLVVLCWKPKSQLTFPISYKRLFRGLYFTGSKCMDISKWQHLAAISIICQQYISQGNDDRNANILFLIIIIILLNLLHVILISWEIFKFSLTFNLVSLIGLAYPRLWLQNFASL